MLNKQLFSKIHSTHKEYDEFVVWILLVHNVKKIVLCQYRAYN